MLLPSGGGHIVVDVIRLKLFKVPVLLGLLDLFDLRIVKTFGLKRGHIYLTFEKEMKEKLILIMLRVH